MQNITTFRGWKHLKSCYSQIFKAGNFLHVNVNENWVNKNRNRATEFTERSLHYTSVATHQRSAESNPIGQSAEIGWSRLSSPASLGHGKLASSALYRELYPLLTSLTPRPVSHVAQPSTDAISVLLPLQTTHTIGTVQHSAYCQPRQAGYSIHKLIIVMTLCVRYAT